MWQKYLTNGISHNGAKDSKIYIRPEPRTAQYYNGAENFLDDVIIALKDKFQIVLLTRDEAQFDHYRHEQFEGIEVPSKPVYFDEIATNCMLFIGAGGTMTREMAVIGIPTISVYQDELLDVDKYLIQLGLMKHIPDLKIEKVIEYLELNNEKPPNKELLQKGKETYNLIKSLIT